MKSNEIKTELDRRVLPLNLAEQRLKAAWQANPERALEQVHTQKEVVDILDAAFAAPLSMEHEELGHPAIEEASFIEENMDCAFVRHLRYLPAFWHTHEFFELLIVLHGQGDNVLENQRFVMNEGDICIHAPGTTHAVGAFGDEDILLNILIRQSTFEKTFFGLMDDDSILSSFFQRVFHNPEEIPYLMIHTGNDPELRRIGQAAYQEYHDRRRYRRQMMDAYLSSFFITLFRRHEQHMEIPNVRLKGASNDNLMFILRYMEANYATVTLKSLASFFNYSERQLQRIIKEATGMSFTQNVQRQQMAKAAEYLRSSSEPIAVIGEKTGFESPNQFRKIFQRYYRMTPSAYRQASRNHC